MFSTIALLGYIFNFSVLYSNYAIEALYTIVVFNKRVDQVVLHTQNYANAMQRGEQAKFNGSPVSTGVIKHKEISLSEKPSLKFIKVSSLWPMPDTLRSGSSVLKDISFSLTGAKKVAIIGRVGCGKTTLLNSIMKEALVTEGSIEMASGLNAVSISE